MTNPYKVLGVHRESTDEEIKVAYYRIAKDTHPDKGAKGAATRRNLDRFVEAARAYAAIRNVTQRARLVATLSLQFSPCGACDGTGTKRAQKGLFHVVITPCAVCHGAGYDHL